MSKEGPRSIAERCSDELAPISSRRSDRLARRHAASSPSTGSARVGRPTRAAAASTAPRARVLQRPMLAQLSGCCTRLILSLRAQEKKSLMRLDAAALRHAALGITVRQTAKKGVGDTAAGGAGT